MHARRSYGDCVAVGLRLCDHAGAHHAVGTKAAILVTKKQNFVLIELI